MRWMTMAAGLTMLTACVGEDRVDATPSVPDCKAAAYAPLVGSNAAAVDVVPGLDLRIIGPQTPVTLDYKPARVNLRVNAAGTITSVDCG